MTEITRLEAQYIDKSKLETLLKDQFGTQYHVKCQDDVIEVTAERKLSDSEIDSVTIRKRC
ncbi:hypothetical protein F5Y07DRAFT_349142 [Xylaria sp. FL0933]|nr:hypothetical protein F5Y07DRAFT_349142 [Xylaria sp. FL0933]